MINLSNTLKKKNNKKGFTLIELIVVIAILAILAAIAIPRLGNFRQSATDSANEATAATIQKAVLLYIADNPNATITSDNLQSSVGGSLDNVDWTKTVTVEFDDNGNPSVTYDGVTYP